jgi:hypothetical protein
MWLHARKKNQFHKSCCTSRVECTFWHLLWTIYLYNILGFVWWWSSFPSIRPVIHPSKFLIPEEDDDRGLHSVFEGHGYPLVLHIRHVCAHIPKQEEISPTQIPSPLLLLSKCACGPKPRRKFPNPNSSPYFPFQAHTKVDQNKKKISQPKFPSLFPSKPAHR